MQKVSIVTLGCPKNLADSEIIKGLLMEKGYYYEQDPALADIIVVNTCGFIEDAKLESINTLLEMAQYKKTGRCRLMVASGCLTQRYGKELMREMPEIDVLMGTTSFPEIVEAINQAAQGRRVLNIRHPDFVLPEGLPRNSLEKSHYAYLRSPKDATTTAATALYRGSGAVTEAAAGKIFLRKASPLYPTVQRSLYL